MRSSAGARKTGAFSFGQVTTNENVGSAGNGARRARRRHTHGPPGHIAPLWWSIGDPPAAPLQPRDERPIPTIDDGWVEVIADAAIGVYGRGKDFAVRRLVEFGGPEERADTVANSPSAHTRPLIRPEGPGVTRETKAGANRRLARNRKVRAANKVAEEDPSARSAG